MDFRGFVDLIISATFFSVCSFFYTIWIMFTKRFVSLEKVRNLSFAINFPGKGRAETLIGESGIVYIRRKKDQDRGLGEWKSTCTFIPPFVLSSHLPWLALAKPSGRSSRRPDTRGVHPGQEQQAEVSCEPHPLLNKSQVISLNWLRFFFLFQRAMICVTCTLTQNGMSYPVHFSSNFIEPCVIPPDYLLPL